MPEPGFLTARCPSCGASSDRVPASLAGRTVRCPRCSARFAVRVDEPAPTRLPTEEPAPTVADEGAVAATVAEAGALGPTVAEDGALAPTRAEGAPPPGPAEPGEWKPGDVVLGLYEVKGLLGQGGMGRVYRVHHRGWGLDLAVKAPLPRVLEAAGGAELFEREAETWVNLGLHPHVVTCHYVRRTDGLPLVFAEYVDGGSLHDAIRSGRLDSADTLLDVAIQFAWGLHHAHEQGLVHRDVKPANVMLTSDGLAKVTDFGLARARSARVQAPTAPGAGHTMTVEGGGGGTPAYVSPEQAAGGALNRRADLWSFALSVLEAFLGGRTWEYGLAAMEVLEAYRRDGLTAGGRPAMPEPVADLLARCFRERPDERPHDLAEVAAALAHAWETLARRPYPRVQPAPGRGSADSLNNRAVSLVDLGRAAEAETLWRRALETEAQHVEATFNSGVAAWAAFRLADPELVRRMEEACASHAGLPRARQLMGRVLLALGQPADALAAFERAASLGGAEGLDEDRAAARAGMPPALRTLRGLPGPVAALSLSPDGRTVAAGSGAEVRVWDAGTGQLLRTIPVPDGPVRALALLPDMRSLAVGLENAPLGLWDLASGRPVRAWARHPGFATSLAVVPGGRFVASGGSDRVVRLWDPASGRVVREMAGHEDGVTAVAAGERHLASASRDGTVRLWALDDGRCLGTLRGHQGRVVAVALDEARLRVVSGGEDAAVRDWGLRSLECAQVLAGHGQGVTAVGVSPDGTRIVSASADRSVRSFDGERLVSLLRLDAAVQAMAVAPDGTTWAGHGTAVSALPAGRPHLPPPALCRPASATEEEARAAFFRARIAEARQSLTAGDVVTAVSFARRAREVPGHERSEDALAVWDDLCARLPRQALRSAWEEARLEGHEDQVLAVAVDGAGSRALTGGLDATLRVWDLAARKAEASRSGHEGAVTAVAFSGSGRAVSAGRDRTVRLWELAALRPVAVLEGHAETVVAVDATADGARAASASWDGTVRLWDLRRQALAHVLEGHGAQVAAVRLSPDGQVVASGGWDGTARLWDAESGRELGALAGHEGNVTAVALHADGRQVATGVEDGRVLLWDARARRRERELRGHAGEITGLAYTPDGRFLLSGSRDRSVRVWDLQRGETVRTLPHPALVLGLALTPVASVLLTACGDRCARLWHFDWEPETAAATAIPPLPKAAPTARMGGETVRARVAATQAPRPTLREDLRRAAPLAVPALPRAARQVPWRRLAAGLGILATVAIAWLAWRRPAHGVRLSPYMAQAVPREVDLIDVDAYLGDCSPGDYERHLDELRRGNPDARDVACLAARGAPGLVADVLDGAPLGSEDALEARRRRRNAASALAGLEGDDAISALCARLGDARAETGEVAALVLGVLSDPAASTCVRDTLREGGPLTHRAAATALRQRTARGLFPVDEAWDLTSALLGSAAPESRLAGLSLVSLFDGDTALAAVRPLQDDADPEVAAAAAEAIDAIARVRRTDQLRPDTGP
jgi:WD40 repeat protein/serine/threonine protein kinase